MTIAIFAWFFIRGNITSGTDSRTAVVLKSSEREFILAEMRGLLSATQGIMDAANQGDLQRIIKISKSVGMESAADVNPALMAKLPLEFKMLGMSVHHDMDQIAEAAEKGTRAPEIQKMLSVTLLKCVACHSAWQLKSEN
jgi:hypothetical protein